jgi:hypothetical protein
MKNVKPMRGQVWGRRISDTDMTANEIKISRLSQSRVHAAGLDGWINRNIFIEDWLFIPQNDLEWLAVNEPEWFHGDCNWVRRDENDRPMYTDRPNDILTKQYTYCTREQWQNMRFDLGLDERPFEEFAKGCGLDAPLSLNCPCTLTPIKETKMIDLSTAVVGDKYKDNLGVVCEYIGMNSGKVVGRPVKSDGISMHNTHYVSISDASGCTKHEPRHWLSQLPDADLFNAGWLAFDNNDEIEWCWYQHEPFITSGVFCPEQNGNIHNLIGIKMPTLTGDEWKLSKISIDELRVWQKENK